MRKFHLIRKSLVLFILAASVLSCSDGTIIGQGSESANGLAESNGISVEAVSGVAIEYKILNDWGNGFTADVIINNNSGKAINGWQLTFTFPGNQSVTGFWRSKLTQSGKNVTVVNESYNALIPNGGRESFGFQATYSGANAKPVNFDLNGTSGGTTSTVSSKQSSSVSSEISISSAKSSQKSSINGGIPLPTDYNLWCLTNRNVARADFPKYADHYMITDGPTQIFRVYTGDWNPRNSGAASCRVEASDSQTFNPGSPWHQFEATYKVNTAIDLDVCIAQLKAHVTELPQIMVIYKKGGVITYQSRGDGNQVLGTGYANKEFTIKMRSNGNQEELYFNGTKVYSGVPFNTASNAGNYFRWGIYMGGISPGNVTVTITKFTRN